MMTKWRKYDEVLYRDPFDKIPQPGLVSSCNEQYVFVKFHKQLDKFGWEGTTSQACLPDDLEKVK